jgi:DNA-binding transcriptional LysR family regulator
VIGLVAAGYGVAVVPASVAGRGPHEVTFARLVPAGPPIELSMAVPDRPPSPVAERFVALARDLGPVRL